MRGKVVICSSIWFFSSLPGTNPEMNGSQMKNRTRAVASLMMGLCLLFSFGSFANTQTHSPNRNKDQKETLVTNHASGTFEVKMNPQAPDDKVGDPTVGRMSIDKQFHGDLEGTSKGQMLAAGTDTEGSAGYVALERVSGTLHGHSGTFALQHSGTMNRGDAQLTITVVPDSGTGQLVGLAGKMKINIVDGKHFYEFEYTLPKPN